MFFKGFGQMLADTAAGNPGIVSRPITWNTTLVEHHAVPLNAIFATIQFLLGIGIAWRPRSGRRWPPRSPGHWGCGGSARASGWC
jgi:hypothetical protein